MAPFPDLGPGRPYPLACRILHFLPKSSIQRHRSPWGELNFALSGIMETVVADVNGSGIPVLSIDLPSGISADTPELIGDCIHASMTVTLGAPKLPLVLPPGEGHAGNVVIAWNSGAMYRGWLTADGPVALT